MCSFISREGIYPIPKLSSVSSWHNYNIWSLVLFEEPSKQIQAIHNVIITCKMAIWAQYSQYLITFVMCVISIYYSNLPDRNASIQDHKSNSATLYKIKAFKVQAVCILKALILYKVALATMARLGNQFGRSRLSIIVIDSERIVSHIPYWGPHWAAFTNRFFIR